MASSSHSIGEHSVLQSIVSITGADQPRAGVSAVRRSCDCPLDQVSFSVDAETCEWNDKLVSACMSPRRQLTCG